MIIASSEKQELPSKTPKVQWEYQAIAKLGGWSNSKRTGKASWVTLWDGWFRLTERVEGFLLAQSLGVAYDVIKRQGQATARRGWGAIVNKP